MDSMYPPPPFKGSWRPHPASYLPFLLFAAFGFWLIFGVMGDAFPRIALAFYPGSTAEEAVDIGSTIAWTLGAGYVSFVLTTIMSVQHTTSWLDDEKLTEDYKFVRRVRSSVPYSQIDGVALSQSVFGRVFGYGKLKLERRGMKPFYIYNAKFADELYDFFQEVVKRNKAHVRN